MNTCQKFAAIITFAAFTLEASAAGSNSSYLQLGTDTWVNGTTTVLSTSIYTPTSTWLYVQSDGRYGPGGAALASAYITVNGVVVSNDSVIDWRQSVAPQQHSFNVIGAQFVGPGTHNISLVGFATGASAYFGAGTNLTAMTTSATNITMSALSADSAQLNFNTVGNAEGTALSTSGKQTILSHSAGNTNGTVISFASGRNYVFGGYGDGMLGIFLNNSEPNIDSMTWSINDLYTGAETQAPFFSQAMFLGAPNNSTVQYVASESPYYTPVANTTNNVKYKVGANSRLISLSGPFQVFGKGLLPTFNYASSGNFRRFAYTCIGTNGFNPSCPPSGQDVSIGSGTVCIPQGHNGVVFFTAKSRVQGDSNDSGGTVLLKIRVNGVHKGSLGVQQLGPAPHAVSTRTISASYLATGSESLSVGCHSVDVIGNATGSFRNLSMNADMPLMWFD